MINLASMKYEDQTGAGEIAQWLSVPPKKPIDHQSQDPQVVL